MTSVEYRNPEHVAPPVGQYSQIAITEPGARLAHIAGQLPLGPDGELVAADFEGQAEFVFRSLAALVEAAGSTMRRLAYLRSYMVRDEDYPRFRAIRARVFAEHRIDEPPPATTVIVAGLVGGSLIELDAVVLC